jgi:hypothetical protein
MHKEVWTSVIATSNVVNINDIAVVEELMEKNNELVSDNMA